MTDTKHPSVRAPKKAARGEKERRAVVLSELSPEERTARVEAVFKRVIRVHHELLVKLAK